MTVPVGLNHLAMSVAPGTLTDEFRDELLAFYGALLGWREIDALRLPDRLTISTGAHTYVNVRERDDVMACHGYEHFGIVVESTADAEGIWTRLDAETREVNLSPIKEGDNGYRVFRFRYLLPMAVEVTAFPSG
jgi:hypothetical protein